MKRKEWKQKAKRALQKNYGRCFIVSFFVTLLVGGTLIITTQKDYDVYSNNPDFLHSVTVKTNTDILNEFLNGVHAEKYIETHSGGFLGTIFNQASKAGSFLFGVLNAINQFLFQEKIVSGIILLIGIFIGIFYWIFVSQTLHVGKHRFFLENRLYPKTRVNRLLLVYRVRKSVHVSLAMLRKNVYQFLWFLTIIGGPIMYYSYKLVPFLLAENPTLSGKEAMMLSKQMMYGHRLETFFFDASFLGYYLFGLVTFNLGNLFYTNPYYEASMAEYYISLRDFYAKEHKEIIYDSYLNENKDHLSNYPEEKYPLKQHESRNLLKSLDYDKHYSVSSYIFFFFTFSIIGWIWEVVLTLVNSGVFVNRGVYYGPWLPIYGSGSILVLFFLKKWRKEPWLTFILSVVLCGVLEYGVAFYLETFKHMKWWDYTGYFLNIHGRVCLEGLLLFGIGCLAVIYILAPLLEHIIEKWNVHFKRVLCVILVFLFAIDFCYTSKKPNMGDYITTEIPSKNE